MDDARIRELAQEVLAKLRESPGHEVADLETRVARLEAALRRLEAGQAAAAAPVASTTVVVAQTAGGYPSLRNASVPDSAGPTVTDAGPGLPARPPRRAATRVISSRPDAGGLPPARAHHCAG